MSSGNGRVVVLGEAAMLSAQITRSGGMKFGLNRPGIDNQQLALDIVHWLSVIDGRVVLARRSGENETPPLS